MRAHQPLGRFQRVPLGEVLETLPVGRTLQQGWSPQCLSGPASDDSWGVLKTTAIQPGRFLDQHNKALPGHLEPRPALEVRPGDLLLTNAGPRARCAIPCLVRSTRPRLMLSGKVYRFRTDPGIMDPRFLELYLLSAEAQADLDARKTGISDSGLNLTRSRFLEMEVPCPDVSEQLAIVEILEDQLSRLQAADQQLELGGRRSESLRQAWLRHALSPVSEPMFALGDLLIDSRGGWSRSQKHTVQKGRGVPYLKMHNMRRDGRLDLDEIVHVEASATEAAKYRIEVGDLLFNSKNSGDLIGKTACAGDALEGWLFNENIMRLRFDGRVDPEFMLLWFQGPMMRRAVLEAASASTNVSAVYQHQLIRMPVWVPAIQVQQRLVGEHRLLQDASLRLTAALSAGRKRATSLRQALLEAAFTGRLTTPLMAHTTEEMASV
jgi:type I restriction enzyme S subunit